MSFRSDPTQEWEWDEIPDDWSHDDPEEDPGVVRHDAQHQHVAQQHLEHVEERLDTVQQPAEGEREANMSYALVWGAALQTFLIQ